MYGHSSGTSMPSPLGEGTRRAALRWLSFLHVADVPRARALFTHHPRYADLTPVQYADGLAWLRETGMVTSSGRPVVHIGTDVSHELDGAVPRVLWSPEVNEALSQTGTAGERALLALLRGTGLASVTHVAAVSDAYGYDIAIALPSGEGMHLEVKSTTDPTRLVVHLTRHEYEVMASDPEWLMGAVLVGADMSALSVAEVSRQWLLSVVPQDQSMQASWESVRIHVPAHVLVPGLTARSGYRALPANVFPARSVWGIQAPAAAPA
ncbi:protein NO VEIN domain-containing protein [Streptomyces sp. PpalLS-921]